MDFWREERETLQRDIDAILNCLRMVTKRKQLSHFLLAPRVPNMAAGRAFSVLLICFLLTPGCLSGKNQPLSYENWHQMLEGEWMIKLYVRFWRQRVNLKFINRCMRVSLLMNAQDLHLIQIAMLLFWLLIFSFAPWCPACKRVAPVWSSLASKAESLGIKVAEVDTTKEPGNAWTKIKFKIQKCEICQMVIFFLILFPPSSFSVKWKIHGVFFTNNISVSIYAH